jgi:hypothetical protein
MIGRKDQSGDKCLTTYRLYRLDGAGRISGAGWIDAADDAEARTKASADAPHGHYELWQKERLVERVRR